MPEQRNIYQVLGELTAEVRGLRRDVQEDRKVLSSYRQAVRSDIQNMAIRLTHVETETAGLARQVDRLKRVTDDVEILRAKAAGAGLLGHWLVRIGVGVVTLGGWLYAAYTWLTGRPPP